MIKVAASPNNFSEYLKKQLKNFSRLTTGKIVLTRGESKALMGGGGAYSYIQVLPD